MHAAEYACKRNGEAGSSPSDKAAPSDESDGNIFIILYFHMLLYPSAKFLRNTQGTQVSTEGVDACRLTGKLLQYEYISKYRISGREVEGMQRGSGRVYRTAYPGWKPTPKAVLQENRCPACGSTAVRITPEGPLCLRCAVRGTVDAVRFANAATDLHKERNAMTSIRIQPLDPQNRRQRRQAAELLVENFTAWPAMEIARAEIHILLSKNRLCFVALDEAGDVVGLVGGLPDYDGNVWELHPLVVKKSRQRTGIGRRLVRALERAAVARGAMTVMLGTDDEADATSLSGVDLYENLPGRVAAIENLREHPYSFYLKCGYQIVGVIPDANGYGKPDILMAKRVGKRP